MSTQTIELPVDRRAQQGGLLFLVSLLVFFLATMILFLLYAYTRRGDTELSKQLPLSFLGSTLLLVVISGLLHIATSAARREKRTRMLACLGTAMAAAFAFTYVQGLSLWEMVADPEYTISPNKGVIGMVVVLAVVHALHVMGGIIALGLVMCRALLGQYDHERFWAIKFSAYYWHFLDGVWIMMLLTFWLTTGGFALSI